MLRSRIGLLHIERPIPARAPDKIMFRTQRVGGDSRIAKNIQNGSQRDSTAQRKDGRRGLARSRRAALLMFCCCGQFVFAALGEGAAYGDVK